MDNKKPILFIFQSGFRQISLPPMDINVKCELINLSSCDDGCLITTEQNHEEVVAKLNNFVGRKIINIYCDSNEIVEDDRKFKGAEISKGNNGEEVIYLK